MVAADDPTWLVVAFTAVPDAQSLSPACLVVLRQSTDSRLWLRAETDTRSREETTTNNDSLVDDHAVTFNDSSADDLVVDVVKENQRKVPRER